MAIYFLTVTHKSQFLTHFPSINSHEVFASLFLIVIFIELILIRVTTPYIHPFTLFYNIWYPIWFTKAQEGNSYENNFKMGLAVSRPNINLVNVTVINNWPSYNQAINLKLNESKWILASSQWVLIVPREFKLDGQCCM